MVEDALTDARDPGPLVVPRRCALGIETGRLNCDKLCRLRKKLLNRYINKPTKRPTTKIFKSKKSYSKENKIIELGIKRFQFVK